MTILKQKTLSDIFPNNKSEKQIKATQSRVKAKIRLLITERIIPKNIENLYLKIIEIQMDPEINTDKDITKHLWTNRKFAFAIREIHDENPEYLQEVIDKLEKSWKYSKNLDYVKRFIDSLEKIDEKDKLDLLLDWGANLL